MRYGFDRSARFEPNVRLAGQAMLVALALFGMGNQLGSAAALCASGAIALYAVMVPGAGWQVALSPATWRFAGMLSLRLAGFAVALYAAGTLADAGPFAPIGSLAFIGVMGAAGFAVASRAWRLAPKAWRRMRRVAIGRPAVVDHWVVGVRLLAEG